MNPCWLGQEVAEPLLHRSYGFQERLVGHEPELLTLAPEAAALLRVVSKLELHPRVKITPQLTKALSYPWSLKKRRPSGIFSQYQMLLSNKKKRGEKTGKEEGLAACRNVTLPTQGEMKRQGCAACIFVLTEAKPQLPAFSK